MQLKHPLPYQRVMKKPYFRQVEEIAFKRLSAMRS